MGFNCQHIYIFSGIQAGGCGDLSVRLRPALIFQPLHANIFLDKLNQVLSNIK